MYIYIFIYLFENFINTIANLLLELLVILFVNFCRMCICMDMITLDNIPLEEMEWFTLEMELAATATNPLTTWINKLFGQSEQIIRIWNFFGHIHTCDF